MSRLVRDLELKARERHRRWDQNNIAAGSMSGRNSHGRGFEQSGPRLHQDRSRSRGSCRRRNHLHSRESYRRRERSRSRDYEKGSSDSPEEQQPQNAAMDAMSRALKKAAWSPFSVDIEQAPMPDRFTRPPFNSYEGKTDPVEHVNHYIQMISLHAHNDTLMCKVFPSSLGPTTLR